MNPRKMKKQPASAPKLSAILACFFLSGAAGLTYQVAWAKALGLIFGHTAYAVATVLAVFMAGLAMGSAYLGKWGGRHARPIALYARIELLVAATGALSLVGLAGVRSLYVTAYPVLHGSHFLLLLLRFVGAAVVLFIPTFLMGGTLPILIASVARNSAELSVRVSQLYWVNTLGAVAGTLITGFVLLPEIGLRLTIACAFVANVLAGLVALRISKDASLGQSPPSRAALDKSKSLESTSRFLLFLFALVGCTAFAYEIAWTRLLAIAIGSSTYAFTLMLAVFLVGAVLGSALFQRFVARGRQVSLATLAWAQLGIGITAVASLALFHWIPSIIPPLLRTTHQTFGGLVLAQFAASALTLLPVATFFGFNFPLVIVLLDRSADATDSHSTIVGKAYAANTVGAIVGSLLTGFWLVTWLGSFRVVALAAAVNLLLAFAVDLRERRRTLALAFDVVCLVAVVGIASSSFFYNRSLLSLSAVLYGNAYEGHLTLGEIADTMDLVYTAEGVNDSISVVRTDNLVALRVNGKVDASTDDATTQLLLGHLGAAFHPAPRRVLIIGFGSGMTASAVARYPEVEHIDCVEIEPAVILAAPYLQTLNRDVLKDPRLHIIFDDARNFLLTTREKYDLIISEPSNPWIAGIATLFTDEYYAAARKRLAPAGMFVQWTQAYSLAPTDLSMIAATLAPHFPEVTLWRASETDLLFLGRTDTSPLQFGHLRSLWQNHPLAADFETMNIHEPEGLAAYFLLNDAAVRELAKASELNTDDRTLLEYRSPQSLLADSVKINQEFIAGFRTGALPANLQPAEVANAMQAGVSTALDLNDPETAEMFLSALEKQPENSGYYIARGRLELLKESLSEAQWSFKEALRLEPDSLDAMHWLAVSEHRSGENAAARVHIDQIIKRNPDFIPALEDEVQVAADEEDFQTALRAQSRLIVVMSDPPAWEYCRLGTIQMATSNFTEAESVLLKGLTRDPYSQACHLRLAELYRQTNRLSLAREHFEWLVRFFPAEDANVLQSLAEVYVSLGDAKSARSILRKRSRIFPRERTSQGSPSLVQQ